MARVSKVWGRWSGGGEVEERGEEKEIGGGGRGGDKEGGGKSGRKGGEVSAGRWRGRRMRMKR